MPIFPAVGDGRGGGHQSERHLNDIHWSSFHRLVKENVYEPRWCRGCHGRVVRQPDFEGLNIERIEAAFGE